METNQTNLTDSVMEQQPQEEELLSAAADRPDWMPADAIEEDAGARGANQRRFLCNNGTGRTVLSNIPLNYFDAEEQAWKPLDSAIEEQEEHFVARSGKMTASLKKGENGNGVVLEGDGISLAWEYVGKATADADAEKTERTPDSCSLCREGSPCAAHSMLYQGIDENTDIEYRVLGNCIKEDIILRGPSDNYAFEFLLHTQGLVAHLSDDATVIELFRTAGTEEDAPAMVIPAPFMIDAEGCCNRSVYYTLESLAEGEYLFTIHIDEAWVNSPARVFPVTIDPQVAWNSANYMFTPATYYLEKQSDGSFADAVKVTDLAPNHMKVGVDKNGNCYEGQVSIRKNCVIWDYDTVYSAKFYVKLYSKYRPGQFTVQADGGEKVAYSYTTSDYYLAIDISDAFRNSDEDIVLKFTKTDDKNATQAYMLLDLSSTTDTRLEVEFFVNEDVPPVKKTFSLTDTAVAEMNLGTGEMVTVIEDVPAENSVMGIPVAHVLKMGNGMPGLGANFRLSIQEKLEKHGYQNGDVVYVYTDAAGDRYGFKEYFYYLDNAGGKQYVDKSAVSVDADGILHTAQGKEVTCEYRSSAGLKLVAPKEDMAGVALYEQRIDEQKQLEDQIASYESTFADYVAMSTYTGEIISDNIPDYAEKLLNGFPYSEMPMSRSDYFQYQSLLKQRSYLLNESDVWDTMPEDMTCTINQTTFSASRYLRTSNATIERSIYEIESRLIPVLQSRWNNALGEEIIECFVAAENSLARLVPEEYFDTASNRMGLEAGENYSVVEGTALYDEDIRELFYQRNLFVHQRYEVNRQIAEQKQSIKDQMDFLKSKKESTTEQLRRYYRDYVHAKAQLKTLVKQVPVCYLSDGDIIRGFNRDGQLIAVMDQYDRYATIEFDAEEADKILRMTDSEGRAVTFAYTPGGYLESVTDVFGHRVAYTVENKKLTKITYPDNGTMTLEYLATGELYRIEGRDKIRCTMPNSTAQNKHIGYVSTAGDFSSTEMGSNNDQRYRYVHVVHHIPDWEGTKKVDISVDETGELETYVISADKQLLAHTVAACGKVTSAEEYEYVPYSKATAASPARSVTKYADKSCLFGAPEEFIFTAGKIAYTTLNQFNEAVCKTVGPVDVVPDGSVVQNETTRYIYDGEQRLIRTETTVDLVARSEDGTEETLDSFTTVCEKEYNARNKVVRTETYTVGEENTAGVTVEETVYDDKGGVKETFTYNSLDPASKLCDAQELGEDGRVVSESDETGENKVCYTYHADGTIRSKTLPNGSALAYGYDGETDTDCITQSTAAGEENSTRKKYTCGLVTELCSGNNTVRYAYDFKRRLKSLSLNSDTPLVSYNYIVHELTYNGVTCEQYTATMANGHKINTVKEKGGKVQRLRSIFGSVTKDIVFSYDNEGRLTGRTVVVGSNTPEEESYAYDALDRTTEYTHKVNGTEDVRETYIYDDRGSLAEKTVTVNGTASTCTYTYKDNAARELDTLSVGELTVLPKTDLLGRSTGKEVRHGNAVVSTEKITYRKVGDHATGMPSGMQYRDGSFLQYTYDQMGNISAVFENGELTARYAYDMLGRLSREDNRGQNKTCVFVYDNNGNLLVRREYDFTLLSDEKLMSETARATHRYLYDGDRMLSYDGENCEYDVMGCPTVYLGRPMTWDENCRLKGYTVSAGHTMSFVYDSHGRRTGKQLSGGEALTFTYDSNGNLLAQSNGISFLYDHAGMMGFTLNGETYLYRKNVQGDVTALLDSNGAVVARYVYDAWGNHQVLNAAGIDITNDSQYNEHVGNRNPIRYRSYYFDAETGLYYLTARYYDPVTGRFISRDEYSYLDPDTINGLNLFAYCSNNPVMNCDPSGHIVFSTLISIFVTIVVSAVVSAAAGAAMSAVEYSVSTAGDGSFSWKGFWAATAGGAISGAVTGLVSGIMAVTGGSAGIVLLAFTAAGAAGGFLGEFAGSMIAGNSAKDALKAGGVGAIFGAIGGFLGGAVQGSITGAFRSGGKLVKPFAKKMTKSTVKLVQKLSKKLIRSQLSGIASSFGEELLSNFSSWLAELIIQHSIQSVQNTF